jgi:hypothetical protein
MDAFAKAVVLTALLMVAVLGVIIVVGMISEDSIPDEQLGIVFSKQVISESNSTYTVKLYSGQVFYVLNSTLYDSIIENQTYVFSNHINFHSHMTIVDSCQILSGTVESKQVAADSTYTVTLTDGRTLYALKPDVYNRLSENQTYVFSTHVDEDKNISIIDSAEIEKIPSPPS